MKIQKINNIANNHINFKSNSKEFSSSENISESRVLPNYDTARAYAIVDINNNKPKYNNVKINEIDIHKFRTRSKNEIEKFSCSSFFTIPSNFKKEMAEIQRYIDLTNPSTYVKENNLDQYSFVLDMKKSNVKSNSIGDFELKDLEKVVEIIKSSTYPRIPSEKEFDKAKALAQDYHKYDRENPIDDISYVDYKKYCEEISKRCHINISFGIPKQMMKDKKFMEYLAKITLEDTNNSNISNFRKKSDLYGIEYKRKTSKSE